MYTVTIPRTTTLIASDAVTLHLTPAIRSWLLDHAPDTRHDLVGDQSQFTFEDQDTAKAFRAAFGDAPATVTDDPATVAATVPVSISDDEAGQ